MLCNLRRGARVAARRLRVSAQEIEHDHVGGIRAPLIEVLCEQVGARRREERLVVDFADDARHLRDDKAAREVDLELLVGRANRAGENRGLARRDILEIDQALFAHDDSFVS
ncbi:hypothetical protein GA845_24280 [Burkholderia pseudomallei]|nr:hypothetical protein [Burkholderia pseudomallei]